MTDDKVEIIDTKVVWVAWTNTDLTEGRGHQFPKAVCLEKATAIRLGHKGSVMGSNCNLTQETAIRVAGQWLVPGQIIHPSKEDDAVQKKINIKEAAIQKAKDAGLTDEDIKALYV